MQLRLAAIKYQQGGRSMYTAVSSPSAILKAIGKPKMYDPFADEASGNRPINKAHVQGIADYLDAENRYIFDSITLYARHGQVRFEPIDGQDPNADAVLGHLYVPLDAVFEIGNGQHRLTGYEMFFSRHSDDPHDPAATRVRVSGQPFVIVEEGDPVKIAQDFVDLQRNAKPLASSIGAAMDRRKAINRLTLELAKSAKIFKGTDSGDRVEYLKNSLSKHSPAMITFASLRFAVGTIIFGFGQRTRIGWEKTAESNLAGDQYAEWRSRLLSIFDVCAEHLPGWSDVSAGKVSVPEMRAKYVSGTAAGLNAFAGALHRVIKGSGKSWKANAEKSVKKWAGLKWEKQPSTGKSFFEGSIVVEGGKVINNRPSFEAAATRLYMAVADELGLPKGSAKELPAAA